MELLGYIDRFGAEVTTGAKVVHGRKLRMMVLAENVVNAVRAHDAAGKKGGIGWAEWEKQNPDGARLYHTAMMAAQGDEWQQ